MKRERRDRDNAEKSERKGWGSGEVRERRKRMEETRREGDVRGGE